MLAWWDGARWREPSDAAEGLPAAAGTTFTRLELAGTVGSDDSLGAVVHCNIGGDDPPGVLLYYPLGHDRIAVAGVANPHPRQTVLERPDAEHQRAAVEVMRGLGVADPIPRVEVVVGVDLEGDGTRERVIAADNGSIRNFSYSYGAPGDASVVFVLHADGRTSIVEANVVVPQEEPGPPSRLLHAIAAVADLNGDGSFEIAVTGSYYEGGFTKVHGFDGGRPALLFEDGCGA